MSSVVALVCFLQAMEEVGVSEAAGKLSMGVHDARADGTSECCTPEQVLPVQDASAGEQR